MSGRLKLFLIVVAVTVLTGLVAGGSILAGRVAQAAVPPDNNGTFAGCGGTGTGGMMGGSGMMGFLDPVTLDNVAQRLDTTAQDLQTKLQAGTTLAELAQGKIAEADLIGILVANHKEMIQLKVKQTYLTQDQANQMIQAMEQAAKTFITTKWQGGTGFHGGMMGGFGGAGMMGGVGGSGMMGGYR